MADDKIKVKTNDGDIIEVERTIAKQWAPIKALYEALGVESGDTSEKPIELSKVSTETLNKIIEWADHHREDAEEGDEPPRRRTAGADEWDKKYFEVKQEMLMEIIMASNYLGMMTLLDMACKTVADMIKGKTPEEVRRTFNIPNDLEEPQTTVG